MIPQKQLSKHQRTTAANQQTTKNRRIKSPIPPQQQTCSTFVVKLSLFVGKLATFVAKLLDSRASLQ
jgi:hypothetical protein